MLIPVTRRSLDTHIAGNGRFCAVANALRAYGVDVHDVNSHRIKLNSGAELPVTKELAAKIRYIDGVGADSAPEIASVEPFSFTIQE